MSLRHRLKTLFRRRDTEAEMAEELRFHLEQRAAELAADGLPADEAARAARRKFGNLASVEERAREAHGWGWLERLAKDQRFAARQLARAPGFSVLAIVTLGLGIGANTSMFSVLNGVLLKPLAYANLDRLDRLYRATPQQPEGNFFPADFLELRQARAGYEDVAGVVPAQVSLSGPGTPAELAYAARATANFFGLLGVTPQLGRAFREGEDQPGRDRVVVLSPRTWRKRYGGAPDVVGRTIRVDGEPHEIVGVLPESFNDWRFLGVVDFFRPLVLDAEAASDRRTAGVRVIGLRPAGAADSAVAGALADAGARAAREHPEANAGSTWRRAGLQATASGSDSSAILPLLIGLSGFVLLIACSNLANLLLARTVARARELAVRAALGASRLQLLRPLIAEALLLALAGGAFALLVAEWFHAWAAARSTGDNGEQVNFALDGHVMAWALGASLVTAVAFGVAPALFAWRLNLNATLKSGGRGALGGVGQRRFRQALIVGQFALAMVLLTGAGLFIRGLDDLNNRRAGWESAQLVAGTVVLPAARYADAEAIGRFQRLLLERVGALPGAAAASASAFTPFFDWPDVRKFLPDGRERPAPGQEPVATFNRVSAGYFDTFGTRLVAGRAFDARDTAGAPPVFVLGQSAARAWFGERDPIGRRVALLDGTQLRWGEVIGVAADVQSITPEGNPVTARVYGAMAQEPRRQFELVVRAAGAGPATLVDPIRAAVAALDPDLPVRGLQPADTTIGRANYQLGVLRDMLTAFGVLGLALAALGVYGAIARTMAQRSGEFAIRLALGASVRDLTRLVLGTGIAQALLGAAIGLAGAVGVARLLAAAYPGIRTDNAAIFLGATAVLVAVALLTCWWPARRAGRVDAMAVLRAE